MARCQIKAYTHQVWPPIVNNAKQGAMCKKIFFCKKMFLYFSVWGLSLKL